MTNWCCTTSHYNKNKTYLLNPSPFRVHKSPSWMPKSRKMFALRLRSIFVSDIIDSISCHPWFFAQHTSSGIVGCLQNSLFCWREDKRARDSFENIPSYKENLHSRFFLFWIYRATCLCGPFRSSEINLLPGARDLRIRRNLVDGVLYRLRVENLSAPFQLRLGRILVQTLRLVTQSK
jgi:hypothetical protein